MDDAHPVKSSENTIVVLPDYTTDLMFEIYLIRGDCSQAALSLSNWN